MGKRLDKTLKDIYRQIGTYATRDKNEWVMNHTFILDMYCRPAIKALYGCEREDADGELSRFLVSCRFETDEGAIIGFLSLHSVSDAFLSTLHQRIVFACAEQILKLCKEGKQSGFHAIAEFMRKCSELDYGEIYASVSKTEKTLCKCRAYMISDKKTRAEYRRRLKMYAEKHGISAEDAARKLVYADIDGELFGGGVSLGRKLYFPVLSGIFLLFLILCGIALDVEGQRGALVVVFLLSFSFFGCAKFLTDHAYCKLFSPRCVMRIDEKYVNDDCRTLIVITSLLSDGDRLYSHLEDTYLSNKHEAFCYGILADLCDSDGLTHPDDEAVLSNAKKHVDALNDKYGEKFYLFTRTREYSAVQGKFTAPERKRGAVISLVRALRGEDGGLNVLCGQSVPSGIKYVITLDSDTQVPPGEAVRMVTAAAHPHNAPEIGENGTVVSGHGIFQPNMATCLESGACTGFSLLTTGGGGFDSYASASYETYSEVFDSANFCGKGIFDVDCFYKCIPDAFADGVILSHDLLEGMYLRCGGLNDVTLYDNTPSNALSHYKREDRWIRGDIQSLTRITHTVKNKQGQRIKNPLTLLSKFKLADNVIRAMTPLFSFAAFLTALFFSHRCAAASSVFCVFYIVMPTVVSEVENLFFGSWGITRKYYSNVLSSFWHSLFYMFCRIAQLPRDAVCAFNAARRSVYRLLTGRRLLDWVSAASAERLCKNLPWAYMLSYSVSLLTGILISVAVRCGLYRFFGLLFIASPFVMFSLSVPLSDKGKKQMRYEKKALEYANDSFSYFTEFVNEDTNYLPPDNFSESGDEGIAYRTSPTNIGLYMLSCLCACDLSLIDKDDMYNRLCHTFDTVEKLKKYEGNLYNWYDVRTLRPLSDFVSSVDSGNFAVCLTSLSVGLREYGMCDLADRADKLRLTTDLRAMYDRRRGLLATGVEVGSTLTPSHYDIYMSEARSTYYYATASGMIPSGANKNTARILFSDRGRIGLGSWSGTCFEYFMPALFLPVYENSMLSEATRYALHAQIGRRAKYRGRELFGISESCYYEFDGMRNYQYKAHGVPSLALGHCPSDEYVLSPYSSFLMLEFAPAAVFGNLYGFEQVGCVGDYGFYEAIDCTPSRTSEGQIIRCYMSHHIGMSICALTNYLKNGCVRRRFMSDPSMRSHRLVLAERVEADAPIFRPSQASIGLQNAMMPPDTSERGVQLSHTVVSNTKDKIFFRSHSDLYLESGDVAITRKTVTDHLGFRVTAEVGDSTVTLPDGAEFVRTQDGVIEASSSGVSLGAWVHGKNSAFCFKIESPSRSAISFEPVLSRWGDYVRHIAFSRLFVQFEASDGIVTFCKNDREGTGGYYLCLTLCTEDGETAEYRYDTVYDKITVGEFDSVRYDSHRKHSGACVQPYFFCVCKEKKYYLIMTCGKDKDKCRSQLRQMLSSRSFVNSAADITSLPCGRLGERIIYGLTHRHSGKSEGRCEDGMKVSDLWRHGISGEDGVFVIDLRGCTDRCDGVAEYVRKYLMTYKQLMYCGVRYTTVILCPAHGYENRVRNDVFRAMKNCGVGLLVGVKNGITVIEGVDEKTAVLIRDSAFCSVTYPEHTLSPYPALLTVNEHKTEYGKKERVRSFVYASKTFGTLTTSRGLGFTFYKNSHFNRLTEFYGDDMALGGESVYVCIGGEYHDLCKNASQTDMNREKTVYCGTVCGVNYTVTVTLHPIMPFKKISVDVPEGYTVLYRADILMAEKRGTVNSLSDSGDGEKLLCVKNVYAEERYGTFIYCKNGVETKFDGTSAHVTAEGGVCDFVIGAYESNLALRLYIETSSQDIGALYFSDVSEFDGTFKLRCNDKALEFMFNEMSLYQAYRCRMLARCGFYQNGGAYGFRDQLQDSLAVLYVRPEETKRLICRLARHQYEQGDVMHWFHPVREVGVRTRCSDDLLWLVYGVYRYVMASGDTDILSTGVYYITSSELQSGEDERYERAVRSDVKESIYMHCVRAVERSLQYGKDGLPLFGSGDWNDGMNKVGGQSVWLGWFLCIVLDCMAQLADIVSDSIGHNRYAAEAERLRGDIESFAYNGKYYIRGTYSDGEVMGERGGGNIDILPQAFAVFAGKKHDRAYSAVKNAYERLYDRELKLVKLLDPPYTDDPYAGYISRYPSGLRENGGQYTHAAMWLAAAKLKLGDNADGYELLRVLNPCDRKGDDEAKKRYGGEEYVFTGDVYTAVGHEGRCGWSWYTGAAGWYYQTVLRYLLGYEQHGDAFSISPHLCREFPHFELEINKNGTRYTVSATLCSQDGRLLDGKPTEQVMYPFDGDVHELIVNSRRGDHWSSACIE